MWSLNLYLCLSSLEEEKGTSNKWTFFSWSKTWDFFASYNSARISGRYLVLWFIYCLHEAGWIKKQHTLFPLFILTASCVLRSSYSKRQGITKNVFREAYRWQAIFTYLWDNETYLSPCSGLHILYMIAYKSWGSLI